MLRNTKFSLLPISHHVGRRRRRRLSYRFFFHSPNATQSQYTFLLALVMAHLPKRAFSSGCSGDMLLTPAVIDFLTVALQWRNFSVNLRSRMRQGDTSYSTCIHRPPVLHYRLYQAARLLLRLA